MLPLSCLYSQSLSSFSRSLSICGWATIYDTVFKQISCCCCSYSCCCSGCCSCFLGERKESKEKVIGAINSLKCFVRVIKIAFGARLTDLARNADDDDDDDDDGNDNDEENISHNVHNAQLASQSQSSLTSTSQLASQLTLLTLTLNVIRCQHT